MRPPPDLEAPDVVRATTTLCFPVVLVLALSYMANSHDKPGEGFTAGVVVAMSILLLMVGQGDRAAGTPPSIAGGALSAGLLLLVLSASWGLVAGLGLSGQVEARWSIGGETLLLSTATVFDLGIFLVIAGGSQAVFLLLARGGDT
ncbi:hypothetical protein L6R50_25840 [Myxococcota bacterium]|nr:hypothetical protein [Myxococcota bacterium]